MNALIEKRASQASHWLIAPSFNEGTVDRLAIGLAESGVRLDRVRLVSGRWRTTIRPRMWCVTAEDSPRRSPIDQRRELCSDRRVSPLANLLRIFGARKRSPASQYIGNYLWRVVFEKAVCRATSRLSPVVVIASPGSAEKLFRQFPRAVKVLHVIDSLPAARNGKLLRHFDTRSAAAEIYPPSMVQKVERELQLADLAIVPSRLVANQLSQWINGRTRIEVIPFGVDTEKFQPLVRTTAHIRTEQRQPLKIVFVGQVTLRKGLTTLDKALRVMHLPIEVEIIGPVFDSRLVRLLGRNVEFTGSMTSHSINEVFAQSDALVLPSLDDAFGLVAAEAASAGLPVVISDCCGASEIMGESGRVFEAGNADDLVRALESLSPLAPNIRAANRQRFLAGAQLSWDEYVERYFSAVMSRIKNSGSLA